MQVLKNIIITGSKEKPILADVFYKNNNQPKPLVIFSHGFKGFKDWGHFNALATRFASEDLIFLKFNFSHNGTTLESPATFDDLEAFGNNNYTIELNDLGKVIDWTVSAEELKQNIDLQKIYLLGHSRGGGISILKAAEDKRIKKIVTWASVSDLVNRNKKKTIETWQKDGVVYATNARTKQQMPLYYQFYEDILENKERFNISKAASSLQIPLLIVHGTADEAVAVTEARHLHNLARKSELLLVEGAGHTFGIKHPFEGETFPAHAEEVISKTIGFFKS